MVEVTFVVGGESIGLNVAAGMSLKDAAIENGIDGIDAICGGVCACATCHIYVEEAWLGLLPAMSEDEEAMLEFAAGAGPNSRLSCQIPVSAALNGIVVEIPESQF
jgi:2Fe-2S ferredoxin